jgi:putative peptide zinc metalloprotease protein
MVESLFSPYWYRVSQLQPRLRRHAQIHRHYYGGELWYVLQDHVTGKLYRFTPVVYHIICLMDGKLTVHELWEKATERHGDNAPTQGDMVRVLSQLHAADVLLCNIPPDTAELFHRYEQQERSKWKQKLLTPLSMRFHLLDPEKFLSRTVRLARPFFSIVGVFLWLVVVGIAVVLACLHWSGLTENVVDRVLSAQNLLLLWLIYPVIKALHEFGHGYAVKTWGGEVHEMGIMLLVLMPIPYVDASSASAFSEKWRRVFVGAAGMMVELFIAAMAMFVWLNVEHGIIHSIAYNVMLIASVSTVLFNGNPLLRYDGYYIMSDILEIPNLAQRSVQYLGYLTKHHLLGLKKDEPPYVGHGERFWLFTYSIASFIYRMLVYAWIILFIAGKFLVIGVLLAVWAFTSMIVIPVFKKIHFILFSPVLREMRIRAVFVAGVTILVVIMILFCMPFPSWTRTEGVVWAPEESLVRSRTSGFVSTKKGEILVECQDPILIAKVKVLKAQLRALQARYDAEINTNRVRARITKEEIANVRANLDREEERLNDLIISSPSDGVFILPDAEDLVGHYLRQGDLVAYVVDVCKPTIRVVVSHSDVDLVRQCNRGILVRFTEHLGQKFSAVIKREVPGALKHLPSTILSSVGGGEIAIDPSDGEGLRPLEKQFQFDIEPTEATGNVNIGGRVYVRFDHGLEPLIYQWYRNMRQLFLRRFNV